MPLLENSVSRDRGGCSLHLESPGPWLRRVVLTSSGASPGSVLDVQNLRPGPDLLNQDLHHNKMPNGSSLYIQVLESLGELPTISGDSNL